VLVYLRKRAPNEIPFGMLARPFTRDPFGALLIYLMISSASIPFCEMPTSKVSAYSGKILFHNFSLY
jgi:hypothetical protein